MAKTKTKAKAKPKAKPKVKTKTKTKRAVTSKKVKKEMFVPPVLPEKDKSVATQRKYGAPAAYKPEFCDMLINFMSKGYSIEAFAGHVNATVASVYRWLKHPDLGDFREAKSIGEAKQRKFWEQAGRLGLMGKIKGFNTSVWIFNMKNRYGWSDKRVDDETKEFESIVIEMPSLNKQQVVSIGPKNVTPKEERGKK
jgi:hypothetical protein